MSGRLLRPGLNALRAARASRIADNGHLKTIAEDADGTNYRDDSKTIAEDADGSNYRDDSKGASEFADGSND